MKLLNLDQRRNGFVQRSARGLGISDGFRACQRVSSDLSLQWACIYEKYSIFKHN